MHKKYIVLDLFLLLLVATQLSSCSVFDPPVVIPCYARVDSIPYVWTKTGEGSRAAYITDAWVYVDDNPVGAFEMPCKFPIIASNGYHQISIFAGIKQDGYSADRAKYPYYTYYSGNIYLKQDSIVVFKPTPVTYTSFANFKWMENFETGVSSIQKVPGSSDTNIFITNTGVFAGIGSGMVVLDSAGPTNYHNSFCGATDSMTLPQDGATQIYLEINYNCNATFSVGMYHGSLGNQLPPDAYVYSTNGVWKKMYINFTTTVSTNTGTSYNWFYVYFQISRPFNSTNTYLKLDNIRLVD